jgi:hypothetical protein
VYIQGSVQHNLFYYVFKETTCFGFHKAILRASIDCWRVVLYNASVNGIPCAFYNRCGEDTELKTQLQYWLKWLKHIYIYIYTYIHQQCGPYRSYSYMIKLQVDVARSPYSYAWVRFTCRDATLSLTYVGSVLTMIYASGEWE